ncbi:amidase [Chondrocystis sp. NIES-4102]|nr:amidase [Chondrocystis sp. NIES-4102]
MENSLDLAFASALELAQLIKERQVTPLELTELYLSRIEQYDPKINSFYYTATDLALADARQKTQQLEQTKDLESLPTFFGVPIGIKDLKSVANMPITYGISAFKNQIATYDEGVVTKIKEAGFIILGKTATSQLGSFPYTEPEGFAPTRNPWNLDYSPGGSSGGSAAAVAAGLCPLALGGDAGGSIRGPAACCGLIGLKPSRGRISFAPVGDRLNGIATHGIITRTVADAAAFLDIASGYITGDPYWLPKPEIPFLTAARQPVLPLKIGLVTNFQPVGEPALECQESMVNIVAQLKAFGHTIITHKLDLSSIIQPFKTIWASSVAASGIPPQLLSPMNQWVLTQSGSAGEYLQAVTKIQLFARELISLFTQFDVLLAPTYMHPAIKIGQWADKNPEDTLDQIINWILPCPAFNISGQPVINIPAGFDHNQVPLGVQLVGRPNSEAMILALATQLEQVAHWNGLRPQSFAE